MQAWLHGLSITEHFGLGEHWTLDKWGLPIMGAGPKDSLFKPHGSYLPSEPPPTKYCSYPEAFAGWWALL